MQNIREILTLGNKRFTQGNTKSHFLPEQRAQFTHGQQPYAVVVGCSDSRVPVETVFDVDMGELFVVRTAGHVLANASKASIRFAIEKLGTRCVVVLGHEDCSAVKAALEGDAPEWLSPIVSHIHAPHAHTIEGAVDEHVLETCAEIETWLENVGCDGIEVLGGSYEIKSGQVHWLK